MHAAEDDLVARRAPGRRRPWRRPGKRPKRLATHSGALPAPSGASPRRPSPAARRGTRRRAARRGRRRAPPHRAEGGEARLAELARREARSRPRRSRRRPVAKRAASGPTHAHVRASRPPSARGEAGTLDARPRTASPILRSQSIRWHDAARAVEVERVADRAARPARGARRTPSPPRARRPAPPVDAADDRRAMRRRSRATASRAPRRPLEGRLDVEPPGSLRRAARSRTRRPGATAATRVARAASARGKRRRRGRAGGPGRASHRRRGHPARLRLVASTRARPPAEGAASSMSCMPMASDGRELRRRERGAPR